MAVQTELHRHLDVSVRIETLLELAQKRGLEAQSTSVAAFREKIFLRKPLKDLSSVLATFSLFSKVLDRPEILERVAGEVVEDCRNDGTRRVELRFSPSFISDGNGLSWDEILDGFYRGVELAKKRYPEMKVGLLCIASRDYGVEMVDKTVEFFLKHRDRFVGFDLAGNEVGFPCKDFETSFKKLKKVGAKITVHAGEAVGPENIWEAIEVLGAHRIGHGIASIRDPKLMDVLREKKICLEMCPTSNWLTQAVSSFESHPLPKVLRAGVPVCVNTDDPGVFGVSLSDEIRICREKMGMSEAEVQALFAHAEAASFIKS
jgi:adenosine deaminase